MVQKFNDLSEIEILSEVGILGLVWLRRILLGEKTNIIKKRKTNII